MLSSSPMALAPFEFMHSSLKIRTVAYIKDKSHTHSRTARVLWKFICRPGRILNCPTVIQNERAQEVFGAAGKQLRNVKRLQLTQHFQF